MVSTKHCCYGSCNSDSRYFYKPHMQGVSFLPFPKPITQGEKCDRWARACGRKDFDRTKVTRNTYICTKHFVGGRGPTPENADPLPGFAVSHEKVEKSKRKRKASTPHRHVTPVSKKQRTESASCSSQSADESSSNFLESKVSGEPQWHCACCKYSKKNDSAAAPIKKDQGTQTIYDKHTLSEKIKSIIMKRQATPQKLK